MRRAVGLGMLAVAVWIGFLLLGHGMLSAHADKAPAAVQSAPAAYVPSPLELAARAPEYEIVAACGKPVRVWVTSSGLGDHIGQTKHFLYPKAEILTVGYPRDPKEQMRYWTFAGAFPRRGNEVFDGAELKKSMPCMSRWADAWDQAGRDLANRPRN